MIILNGLGFLLLGISHVSYEAGLWLVRKSRRKMRPELRRRG